MSDVHLSLHELFYAAEIGVARRVSAIRRRLPGQYGMNNAAAEAWSYDIDGACAEYALAKYLNVFWSGSVGDLRAKDVGKLQVRSSRRGDASLLLNPKDPDEDVFVLVTGADGDYCMRGWIVARDGKLPEYWRQHNERAAFFVPQFALHPMDALALEGLDV